MTKTPLELDTDLQFLERDMERVAGEWNGDESGLQEERSTLAADILEKSQELRGLLDEFYGV